MNLHVDYHIVERDTVYGDTVYAGTPFDHTFSNHDFHVTGSGVMTYLDTVSGSNGCDSITTIVLIIEEIHKDTICESEFSSYTWRGNPLPSSTDSHGYYEFPGTKTINGITVDTVSYLLLTVNPEYTESDAIDICLYEETHTQTYSGNEHVTITTTVSGVEVTSSSTGVEVVTVNAANGDFQLKMKTVNGCDSIVNLHVDYHIVERDTVYKDTLYAGTNYTTVFSNRIFTVDSAGTYTIIDTVTGSNGCDSITTRVLIVEKLHKDTICDYELPSYTWRGNPLPSSTDSYGYYEFPGTKIINGTSVDTISYLLLTIKAPLVVTTPLECPSDLVFTLWYGRCDTVVTLTEMATMDPPVPNTRIVNDLSLYNPLTEGTHHITWSLLDECDNVVQQCVQTITVQRMPCDSAKDYDGNVYPAAYIGCDCWTLINLKSEHYSDGTPIAEYTRYMDSDSLEDIYGKLYSWYSSARVPEGDDSAVPADSLWPYGTYVQGICPAGWALPTVEDYRDMVAASGNQAGLVKSPSTEVWLPGRQGIAPNLFNAYGAGYYEGGTDRYYNLMGETHFWASDYRLNSSTGSNFELNHYCDTGLYQESLKGLGYSIRCVKRIYIMPE